ncbi:hypothetical protein GRH07_003274 [Salmonella bongori]|nr:hypothetical protein [Salmonella bongori]EDP8659517.1 hypothetical protein [Salmonella bongori]
MSSHQAVSFEGKVSCDASKVNHYWLNGDHTAPHLTTQINSTFLFYLSRIFCVI